MKPDLNYWKCQSYFQSKSTSNSRASLSSNKFRFEPGLSTLWTSSRPKRGGSSGNILDLSETCMHDEETTPIIRNSLNAESQTDMFDSQGSSAFIDNKELVAEIIALRNEINELKEQVKDLQMFNLRSQLDNNQAKIGDLEKENNSIKKILRPPIPRHRHTKSNNLL